jgi:hypothetical protein
VLCGLSNLQRLLAILGCVAAAVVLHTGLCEWVVHPVADVPERHVLAYTFEGTVGNLQSTMARGIFSGERVSRGDTIVFGIAVPLLLLTASLVLLTGWRRARRLDNGQCLRCGYDLHGHAAEGCPECGWHRTVN